MSKSEKFKNFFATLWTKIKDFFIKLGRNIATAFTKPTVKQKLAYFSILRTIAAIAIAVVITIIILLISSDEPGKAMSVLFFGAFKSKFWIGEIFRGAVPLIFAGVAASIMLKCGQFNMIGEGSFYIGGLVGALVAIYLPFTGFFALLIALLTSMVVTSAVGFVPALLKAKLNVNEFVVSLMLNFVMLWVGLYFLQNFFRDSSSGDIATSLIPENSTFSILFEGTYLTSAIIVAIFIALFAGIFIFKTKYGYTIRMTGDNKNFTTNSGLSANSAIIYSQVIGAGIAGLGGAVEILSSIDRRFSWKALPGYGFDGFIVAILAGNNPFLVPFAALFLSYLRTGATLMAVQTDVASELIFVIQAIIIIIVAGQGFMAKLKNKIVANKKAKKEVAL